MAAGEPLCRQAGSINGSVKLNGFDGITRARGLKSAMAGRPEKRRQNGRERHLIEANGRNHSSLSHIHWVAAPVLDLRKVNKKSRSTSLNFFPAIDGRATKTTSIGRVNSF